VTVGCASVRRGAALVCLAAAIAAGGCGKKGVPLPPLRVRPEVVKGLKVRQRGDKVLISLDEPKRRTDGSEYQEDVVLRLTLLPEPGAPGPVVKGRRARASAALKGAGAVSWLVPRETWSSYRVGPTLEIPISLRSLEMKPASGATSLAGRQASFVAEVQEGKRKKSALTPPIPLTLCDPPPVPTDVEARLSATGIAVWWNVAVAPATHEIHLYRADPNDAFEDKPYRVLPPHTRSFNDGEAAAGKTFRYQVRVGTGTDPLRCESEAAGEAEAQAADLFPPARPEGLAAAAEENLIRLFWTPGPEPDLAGYIVYRSGAPGDPFRPLTLQPITSTTYADTDVRKGVRYTYVVSAVDSAPSPNQSGWSDPAEETLP
jgi:hypothetical protein